MRWSSHIHTGFLVSCATLELPRGKQDFDYGAVTLYRITFQISSSILFYSHIGVLNPSSISETGLGCCNFARHYFRNRFFTFFSSRYLDVSVPWVPFISLFYLKYDSSALPLLCFHIRTSAGQRSFAAHRSFSQLITSFLGAWCQGIHHMLFVA